VIGLSNGATAATLFVGGWWMVWFLIEAARRRRRHLSVRPFVLLSLAVVPLMLGVFATRDQTLIKLSVASLYLTVVIIPGVLCGASLALRSTRQVLFEDREPGLSCMVLFVGTPFLACFGVLIWPVLMPVVVRWLSGRIGVASSGRPDPAEVQALRDAIGPWCAHRAHDSLRIARALASHASASDVFEAWVPFTSATPSVWATSRSLVLVGAQGRAEAVPWTEITSARAYEHGSRELSYWLALGLQGRPPTNLLFGADSANAFGVTRHDAARDLSQRAAARILEMASRATAPSASAPIAASADGSNTATISAPVEPSSEIPAGWYADPAARYELRYWSGTAWTEHVSRADGQYTDPPVE
jgi:hypothetical protein